MVVGESVGTADVAIIGAGFGGYTAAIRLAELGRKVVVIDHESVGGVCLHHGCIPTKALIHAAETFHEFKKAGELGISFDNLRIDFSKAQQWKQGVVDSLDRGIRLLLRQHGVQLIKAMAFFESSDRLGLVPAGEDEHLEINAVDFKNCIIASGSKERGIPGVPVDGRSIMTSKEIIELRELPSSILIIGGGYIGVEVAQLMAKLGVRVIVVEALPSILSLLDDEFSSVVRKNLEGMNAEICCNAKVEKAEVQGSRVKTTVALPDGKKEFVTDKVLVAVGRIADATWLRLGNTKVKTDEKGFIVADRQLRTTDPKIFAIGDVIGGAMLAHKAAFEGKLVAEVIAGKKCMFDSLIPYAIFSDPEIGGVGLTEKEAKKSGINYSTRTVRASALGKARIMGAKDSFFKVVYDGQKVILGVHIACPRAADLIGEAVLAMEMGATLEDLALIIHPHPTLVEGFSELADAALGQPINSA